MQLSQVCYYNDDKFKINHFWLFLKETEHLGVSPSV